MRKPQPFFRKFTNSWYVQLGPKQINLGPDRDEAFQKYYELMANRGQARAKLYAVADVFEKYLDWLRKSRSVGTYDKSAHYLSHFIRFSGKRLKIDSLDSALLVNWIESTNWKPSSANDAISIVQRTFNWAVRRGLVDRSPVVHVEGKPAKQRREVVFSDDDWKELRGYVTDQPFGDLLDFMWITGCRPLEARTMESRHVDFKNALVIFPPSEAKGKKTERVIFLPDDAIEICNRGVQKWPKGPILRNTFGTAWTRHSINCRFKRLKLKFKRECCAYAIRHSFATEGLKRGMDSLTLAQIMGHADTSMLAKYYAHLSRNTEYLRDQAKRVRGHQN